MPGTASQDLKRPSTQFLDLPIEIRLQIWACFQELTPPNIFHAVHYNPSPNHQIPDDACFIWPLALLTPMKKVPVLLLLCHESRAFALPEYSLGFDYSHRLVPDQTSGTAEVSHAREHSSVDHPPRGVYWNRANDVIVFERQRVLVLGDKDVEYLESLKQTTNCEKWRRVAVDFFGLLHGSPDAIRMMVQAEVLFVMLERAKIFLLPADDGWQRLRERVKRFIIGKLAAFGVILSGGNGLVVRFVDNLEDVIAIVGSDGFR